MTITPLEIENTKFRNAFTGYNKADVEQLLARVSQELEARLRQIEDLQRRIAQLEESIATYRESEELLKNSVVLAQRTSDEIIASAHKQADAIKRDAESEGRETRLRLAALKSDREQFEYAFHGLLSGFLTRLEQGNPALAEPAGMPQQLAASTASNPMPDSHSHQLLKEVADQGYADTPQPERIPDITVPNVPNVPEVPPPPTPGQPSTPKTEDEPDAFEQAIASAEPMAKEEWPKTDISADPHEDEDADADYGSQTGDDTEDSATAAMLTEADLDDDEMAADAYEEDPPHGDRLPLD